MLHGRSEGQIRFYEDRIKPTITTMNIHLGCSSLYVVDIDMGGTQDRGVSDIPFAKVSPKPKNILVVRRADPAPIYA